MLQLGAGAKAPLRDHRLTYMRKTSLCRGRGWDCAELIPWERHMSEIEATCGFAVVGFARKAWL